MPSSPTLYTAAIAIVAIVAATVAVCIHAIDAQSYTGIVGTALGAGIGIGAHASGVKQGKA